MMTSASSLAFPGSKTLAGWWRQLSSQHPLSFGVGYLFLHRVEAPVLFLKPKKIERFSLLILEALEMDAPGGSAETALLDRLHTRLRLERSIILQILRALRAEGLAGNAADGTWAVTVRGRHGIKQGEIPVDSCERRIFHFLEQCDPAGVRSQPPHFVNVRGNGGVPWQPGDTYPFDAALLRQCLERPESWKQQVGFPLDVRQIPDLAANDGDPDWQRVIVDQPERVLVVLALVPGGDQPRLLGFSARQEGWVLSTAEPILAQNAGWQAIFPQLADPPPEVLQQAWRSWAQPRGLSDSQIAACAPERIGHRLRVQTPTSVVDHLHKTRSEVFKGDTWILIGDGRVRAAVNLELVGSA